MRLRLRRLAAAILPERLKQQIMRGYGVTAPLLAALGKKPKGQYWQSTLTALSSIYCRRRLLGNRQDSAHTVLENLAYKNAATIDCSIIILNDNGMSALRDLLPSLARFEQINTLEVILVDHDSSDESSDYAINQVPGLAVKVLQFSNKNTFSFANNIAAQQARGSTLVLMDSNVVLDQAVLQAMSDRLRGAHLGVVGASVYGRKDNGSRSEELLHNGIVLGYNEHYSMALPKRWQCSALPDAPLVGVSSVLMMCAKDDYLAIGGLSPDFIGGYEDIDFCLRMARKLGKNCGLAEKVAVSSRNTEHQPEISSAANNEKVPSRLSRNMQARHNIEIFRRRHAASIAALQRLASAQHARLNDQLIVGLVISDLARDSRAGDVFTAREFATALRDHTGWHTVFLAEQNSERDWYDLSDINLLIVLLDHYDLSRSYNQFPGLSMVCWARNWFDRWVARPWFKDFDLKLASSETAAQYLASESDSACELLRIATNPQRFAPAEADPAYASDYCFTGSYWGADREIENFRPDSLPFDFALYGEGWDKHRQFQKYTRGFANYERMPEVYRATRLLIDDANHVTKPWGSVNSRVFDGLAAGTMVISNGAAGISETFTNELPTYGNVEELQVLVTELLSNEVKRTKLQRALRSEVLERHCYRHRATEFENIWQTHLSTKHSIAIKIAVPHRSEQEQWGDYHFASALQRELIQLGHSCRVDIIPEWYGLHTDSDEVVITLRGLSRYQPDNARLNLLWIISHPEQISDLELQTYDHVFVASNDYASTLQDAGVMNCTVLLQCTDPRRFYFSSKTQTNTTSKKQSSEEKYEEVLFIGNSRKQDRPIVQHAIEAKLDISVYGTHWQDRIPARTLKGHHIANETLHKSYSNCGVLLNDHWPSMREHGFISNRLFDAAACEATVVSDDIAGLDDVFDGLIYTYANTAEDLKRQVNRALDEKQQRALGRKQLAEKVAREHSFAARAKTLHDFIVQKDAVRRIPELQAQQAHRNQVSQQIIEPA